MRIKSNSSYCCILFELFLLVDTRDILFVGFHSVSFQMYYLLFLEYHLFKTLATRAKSEGLERSEKLAT